MGATRVSRWSAGIVTAAVVSDCCCGPGVAQRIALPGSSKAAQVTATQPRISFARFPVRIAFGFISSLRFGFSLLNVALLRAFSFVSMTISLLPMVGNLFMTRLQNFSSFEKLYLKENWR